MQTPIEFKVDKNAKEVLIAIVNSPAFLAIVLAICITTSMGAITQRMDQMVQLVATIKADHDATPRLLADIRQEIRAVCGKCQGCVPKPKTEVNGGHG